MHWNTGNRGEAFAGHLKLSDRKDNIWNQAYHCRFHWKERRSPFTSQGKILWPELIPEERYNVTCILKAHLDHTNIWFLVGITTLAMDSFCDSLTMSPFTVLRRGGGEGCMALFNAPVLKLKPGHVLKTRPAMRSVSQCIAAYQTWASNASLPITGVQR